MMLSVIVPSIGRPGLMPLIQSLGLEVEWVIVFDESRHDRREAIERSRRQLGQMGIDYRVCGIGGDYGQAQRNAGMGYARGNWLAFSQDDQIFTDAANKALADLYVAPKIPHLFRLRKWTPRNENLVWREKGTFELGMVDGDCMVVPNVPSKLGMWGKGYCGDWDFLSETAALWGGQIHWRDEIIQQGVSDAVR